MDVWDSNLDETATHKIPWYAWDVVHGPDDVQLGRRGNNYGRVYCIADKDNHKQETTLLAIRKALQVSALSYTLYKDYGDQIRYYIMGEENLVSDAISKALDMAGDIWCPEGLKEPFEVFSKGLDYKNTVHSKRS